MSRWTIRTSWTALSLLENFPKPDESPWYLRQFVEAIEDPIRRSHVVDRLMDGRDLDDALVDRDVLDDRAG